MGKVILKSGFHPEFVRNWYLVANRTEAVIYSGNINRDFHFLSRWKNPEGKLTELQLVSDKPGRKFSSSRSGTRHGCEPRTKYHEQVARQFARRIGKTLDKALAKQEFTDLIVLAEPHFLGLLNQSFSKKIKDSIKAEVPREWNGGSDDELEKYLQKKMA